MQIMNKSNDQPSQGLFVVFIFGCVRHGRMMQRSTALEYTIVHGLCESTHLIPLRVFGPCAPEHQDLNLVDRVSVGDVRRNAVAELQHSVKPLLLLSLLPSCNILARKRYRRDRGTKGGRRCFIEKKASKNSVKFKKNAYCEERSPPTFDIAAANDGRQT